MGQVLSTFMNGYPGAVSRSVDDVIVSLPNLSASDIEFGKPVFLRAAGDSVLPFDSATHTDATRFLGFTVRVADKTPDIYGSNSAGWKTGDPVDVLVRGTLVVAMEGSTSPGGAVYIRKSDGKLTANAGAADSTILLPNVSIRRPKDTAGFSEIVVKDRHLI